MWVGRFVINTTFPLHDRAPKVGHSASYVPGSRLLVAAGGSLRFGCQRPTPRCIRSSGHPFRIAINKEKYTYRQDSKRSVDKKPDIGRWPGVGPTHNNLRLAPNRRFLLAGLYCTVISGSWLHSQLQIFILLE